MYIGQKLMESVRTNGLENTLRLVDDGLKEKKWGFGIDNFSIRRFAESALGEQFHSKLEFAARQGKGNGIDGRLQEAYGATDVSNFAAISGQLFVTTIYDKYKLATRMTDEMVTVEPTNILTTRIVPGLSYVKAPITGSNIQPQQPYPTTDFGPQYFVMPAPEKFGEIAAVTLEQVVSDLTRQIQETLESVGTMVGYEVELRRLRVISGIENSYNFNGTTYNTYLSSGSWVNLQTGFTFVDWNSINIIEQLFYGITDPYTGLPIDVEVQDILVTPALKYPMMRVLNATEIRSGTSNTNDNVTISKNVIDTNYNLYVSKLFKTTLVNGYSGAPISYTAAKANTVVIAGNFKRAFGWLEVRPLEVIDEPTNAPASFEQDIVFRKKARAWGKAFVRDPRYAQLAYNSAA